MSTTKPAHTTRPRARQARETRDAQRYLRALFARAQPGALIDVRYRYRTVMRQRFLPAADLFTAARTIVRLGINTDVYVAVAARHQPAGDKTSITSVWTLWADLDDPDAHSQLGRLPVAPAIVIASGSPGHLHAYWPLTHPVSILAAEQANRRLAAHLEADAGAVTNAATILRPPGTYNFKSTPPTPVVLERCSQATRTLQAVTAAIAEDPAPPTPPPPRGRPTASRGQDPLRALDPALYVSVLTGQQVGRSRKITCPFHEDRTPSLHVYHRPEEGWYCFGCNRHGHTVYDFAGALWNLETRGQSFLVLRARLYELFLPGQPPPAPPPSSNERSRRTPHAAQLTGDG
jgi:CHC2 zinc finger/RepB DNA-primase from phage plasmid